MPVKGLFQIARVVRRQGAFGMFMYRGLPFATTLERTFDDDGHGRDRVVVPDGISQCRRGRYHKGGYPTFEILVPGHDLVKFHKGNKEIDSQACILVGEHFHDFDAAPGLQDPGIGNSRGGFEEFMQLAADYDTFDLYVTTVEV